MKTRAIVINAKDTVATALEPIEAGERLIVDVHGHRETVHVVSQIPQGHKFSLKNIRKGEKVVKYGEPIGVALADIGTGEHIHVHNIVSESQTEDHR